MVSMGLNFIGLESMSSWYEVESDLAAVGANTNIISKASDALVLRKAYALLCSPGGLILGPDHHRLLLLLFELCELEPRPYITHVLYSIGNRINISLDLKSIMAENVLVLLRHDEV